jgi:hypothetical protein
MRHSSSLIAGTSCGTIDGTGLIKSVWMSGIESPVGNPALCSVVGEWDFFGLDSWRGGLRGSPGALLHRDSASFEKGNKSLPQGEFLPAAGASKGSFCPLLVPRHSGLIRPLQGSGALLYAARCEQVSPIPR